MQAPKLPLAVRALNRAGGAVRALGVPLGSLDADALLAGARKTTGLDDYGDDEIGGPTLREPLQCLIDSLESEARLTTLGRLVTKRELSGYLAHRLQIVDWHRREPEITRGEIRNPIFIVGQGRTGTTVLHELLALDPANRVPMTWEADLPCPPPERDTYTTDPRIAQSQAMIDSSERLIPDFKRMHRMGAQLPQECVRLTGCAMASMIFTAQWRVPTYTQWLLEEAPMEPVYRWHRRFLQLLQWRCPAERWVLKTPAHLWCIPALLGEYPDARFIQTHRDPLKVLSSLSSLEMVLRTMTSDPGTPREIAAEWSRWTQIAYDRSVRYREEGLVDPNRIVDVQFRAFMSDPIAEIRRIYTQFEIELSAELEERMRAYLGRNPDDRDGSHRHRFADTGLDESEERAKVKRYQEYFDVESEASV